MASRCECVVCVEPPCIFVQVVYVTAIVPYILLVIMLIWNSQLEGAWLGLKYYLIPDWSKLRSAKVS